jgi:hypothetical protein
LLPKDRAAVVAQEAAARAAGDPAAALVRALAAGDPAADRADREPVEVVGAAAPLAQEAAEVRALAAERGLAPAEVVPAQVVERRLERSLQEASQAAALVRAAKAVAAGLAVARHLGHSLREGARAVVKLVVVMRAADGAAEAQEEAGAA